jgi:hypothetical protein
MRAYIHTCDDDVARLKREERIIRETFIEYCMGAGRTTVDERN